MGPHGGGCGAGGTPMDVPNTGVADHDDCVGCCHDGHGCGCHDEAADADALAGGLVDGGGGGGWITAGISESGG